MKRGVSVHGQSEAGWRVLDVCSPRVECAVITMGVQDELLLLSSFEYSFFCSWNLQKHKNLLLCLIFHECQFALTSPKRAFLMTSSELLTVWYTLLSQKSLNSDRELLSGQNQSQIRQSAPFFQIQNINALRSTKTGKSQEQQNYGYH